jgi:regulator of protease activity HflC (stomatin/prohibitin superfamily)
MTRVSKFAALAAIALTTGCGSSVQPGQAGLRYFGYGSGLQREVKGEGFYYEWPWDNVYVYNVTWQSHAEDVDTLTADVLHVPIRISVTFRPKRAELRRLATEIGRTYYRDIIQPAFLTISRAEFAKYRHNDLARSSPMIEVAVRDKLRQAIGGKPIEIDRVSIMHIEYDPHVTGAISEKLATAERVQQKASELKIALQDAEIARATASGRGDSIRIQAQGEAEAIVLKGEAQGKAQAAIEHTLTPSFLKYKAFDSDATRYYFVPVGKDGLPIIVDAGGPSRRP